MIYWNKPDILVHILLGNYMRLWIFNIIDIYLVYVDRNS